MIWQDWAYFLVVFGGSELRHQASQATSPASANAAPGTPELVRRQIVLEEMSSGSPPPAVISLSTMASSRRGQRRRDGARAAASAASPSAASPSPLKTHARSSSSPGTRPAATGQMVGQDTGAGAGVARPTPLGDVRARRRSLHKADKLEIVFQNLGAATSTLLYYYDSTFQAISYAVLSSIPPHPRRATRSTKRPSLSSQILFITFQGSRSRTTRASGSSMTCP